MRKHFTKFPWMNNFSLCIQFLTELFLAHFQIYKLPKKKKKLKGGKKGLFHDKEINEETYLLMDF